MSGYTAKPGQRSRRALWKKRCRRRPRYVIGIDFGAAECVDGVILLRGRYYRTELVYVATLITPAQELP